MRGFKWEGKLPPIFKINIIVTHRYRRGIFGELDITRSYIDLLREKIL
jgi:hypothetical protein